MDGYCEIYKRVIVEFPAFMKSKDLHSELQYNKLLITDPFILWPRWPKIIEKVQKASKDYPWEIKIQKSYWRDIFCGQSYQDVVSFSDISKYYIRLHTVNLSNIYPNFVDHKPTGQDIISKQTKSKLHISYEMSPEVDYSDHMKYKYLLCVDGWSAVFEKIPWIMFSNSVLLKHQTGKVQWFHDGIVPYIHYIPLKADLSDIVQQIQFLKTHDQFAKNIKENANKFAKERFEYEKLQKTLIQILNQYTSYQHLSRFYKYKIYFFKGFFKTEIYFILSAIMVGIYFIISYRLQKQTGSEIRIQHSQEYEQKVIKDEIVTQLLENILCQYLKF